MNIKKTAQLTGHNAAIFALAEGPDERQFFSGAGDGWVVQWDLDNPDLGKLVAKVEQQVFSLCFLKKQNALVAGDMNGGIHWIDVANPENTKNIAHHQRGVFDILAIGEHVFTVGGEGKITRWSADEGRALESYHLANQALRCIDFCEIRNEIAVGGSDNAICFLDAGTLELRHTLRQAHANSVFTVRYTPNGRHLLSGGRDAHLNVWDLDYDHHKFHTQPAHWYTINHLVFHPDGHLFATASRDKTLKIWDAANFELLKVLEGGRDGGHLNSVNRLLWSSHENLLVSASDDRTLVVWATEY
ncbi:MAG: WD40 repeat domain-containing protein [Bacteroidetes bacterium]|nr:WD40 repeat domain-containing protein [Bacteroidota bacterium]